MAKKRKPEAITRLDEVDRTIYSSFRGAANSLSQLYSTAMNNQRLSFLAGERHALEKLYQWILRPQEGVRITTADIITYLQNELEYGVEEPPQAPTGLHSQHHRQTHAHNSGSPVSASRSGQSDNNQGKSIVFSNALSSPARGSLQHCQSAEAGSHSNSIIAYPEDATRTNEMEPNSPVSVDSMDIHSDSS